MSTLKELPVGSSAKVKRLHGDGALRRRLLDMGLTPGVEIHLRKVAPLGDPLEISLRGYDLLIRKSEAEAVELQEPASLTKTKVEG